MSPHVLSRLGCSQSQEGSENSSISAPAWKESSFGELLALPASQSRVSCLGMAQGKLLPCLQITKGVKQKCTGVHSCKRNSHRGDHPGVNPKGLSPI